MLDLKSGDPAFKSSSDHRLDYFQAVPGSTPRLCLYVANWFASCLLSLEILHLFSSFVAVAICTVCPCQPMTDNIIIDGSIFNVSLMIIVVFSC